MNGLFELTGVLALLAILVTLFVVPSAPSAHEAVSPAAPSSSQARSRLIDVATEPDLLRLNLGIFVLHCVQMSMFVVVPRWLVERVGIPLGEHWKLYLAVVVLSFAIMLGPLIWGERRGHMRRVFLGAVALLALVALSFSTQPTGLVPIAGLLLAFFTGFNILEASLPSLVSRIAPPDAKGAALGIYNTMQALGLFTGGALGGWVQSRWGGAAVFAMCTGLLVVWLAAAAGLRRWPAARGARVG
jgi:predicted MFS family arabinose efflux permease